MKLSALQIAALEKLAQEGGRGSYRLGCTLGTLNSLALKGLARASRDLGAIFSPHIAIKWYITDAGRALLHERGPAT